jgi:Bacterial Ig domain
LIDCNEENTSKILFRSTNALFFFLFALLVTSTITASPLFMESKIAPPIQKAYSISSMAPAPHTQLPSPHSSTTTRSKLTNTPSAQASGHSSTPAPTKPTATAITPRANPAIATTTKDKPVNITLIGTDSTGNPLKFFTTIKPSHGTLGPISCAGSFSASVTYTPKKHYTGTDSFWFKVRDSVTHKASSAAYVHITVS